MSGGLPAPLAEIDGGLTATGAEVVSLVARALSDRPPAPDDLTSALSRVTAGRRQAEDRVLGVNMRHSEHLLGESRRYLDAAVVVAVALERTAALAAEAAHHRRLAGPAPARAARLANGVDGAAADAVAALHTACAAFFGGDVESAASAHAAGAAAAARARWAQGALTEALAPGTCAWAARSLLASRCIERVAENARLVAVRRLRVAAPGPAPARISPSGQD